MRNYHSSEGTPMTVSRFMSITNFPNTKPIPKVTTRKSSPTTTNFAKGIYTYKPNDTMDYDEVYLAQNARFERIGEYKTRRGLAKMCEPIGKSVVENTYVQDYQMVAIENAALTISTEDPIYSINLTVAASNDTDYGVLQIQLLDSEENVVATSCAQNITTTPTDTEFIFKDAPTGDFTVSLTTQGIGAQKFLVACEGGTTTPMYKINTATAGQVTNIFEANIDGTKSVLFTFKKASDGIVSLYVMDENGSLTPIRTLPSGVEKVRFLQNQNQIRYADGVESPHILDPSNSWSDNAINTIDLDTGTDLGIKVSNITSGTQENIIYFDAETTTQTVWCWNFNVTDPDSSTPANSYDKFGVNFRINLPAINTGDPLTAVFNLGGAEYYLTSTKKYYVYWQTVDVWNWQASSAQHGTFSQESCVCDLNYAYYACEDGIYIFDGSSEASITEKTIQSTYDAIQNKESIVLELYKNRLYVFYSSDGSGINDSCLVYNINLRLWESFDTGTCVSATSGRKSPSKRFICGSSHYGQLFLYENQNNDYADLGAPILFDLETSYLHFGTPSQLHRITKWRPEFSTVDGNWTIKCGYALDFTDNVKYAFSINLKNNTPIKEEYVWDNPSDYGNPVTPTKLATTPQVNGQFRRCQLRYQLHSAYTPVNFKSHTLSCETQRLR